ncbi:O-antigen ligase family protein [Methylomagnum sp.]
MDMVILIFAAIDALLLAALVLVWCTDNYLLALALVFISPLISAVGVPNGPGDSPEVQAPGLLSALRIGVLFIAGLAGLLVWLRSGAPKIPTHLKLLGLFILFSVLSVTYSIDPTYTFTRSSAFAFLYVFLLGFNTWLNSLSRLYSVLQCFFICLAMIAFINLLAIPIFPNEVWYWEDAHRFQGLLDQPNGMGALLMLSYPVLAWKYSQSSRPGKFMVLGIVAIILPMHIMTGSRGSIISSVLVLILWQIVQHQYLKALLVALAVTMTAVSVIQLFPSHFHREDQESVAGLTGRDEFWQAATQLVLEKPIIGYGYGVEGKVWSDPRFNESKITLWSGNARSSLHNGYLSIAIGGGLLCLFIWIPLLIIPVILCGRAPPSIYKAYVMSVLIVGLVLNFAESNITGANTFAGVVFWLLWIIAGRLTALLDISKEHSGSNAEDIIVQPSPGHGQREFVFR